MRSTDARGEVPDDEDFWPEWPHERGCDCWDCRHTRRWANEED